MSDPAVPCHRIGARREHYLLPGAVWCSRCVDRHDAYGQVTGTATRAGEHRHHPDALEPHRSTLQAPPKDLHDHAPDAKAEQ